MLAVEDQRRGSGALLLARAVLVDSPVALLEGGADDAVGHAGDERVGEVEAGGGDGTALDERLREDVAADFGLDGVAPEGVG
jgi:hypothetical protein